MEKSPVWESDPEEPGGSISNRAHIKLKVFGSIGAEGWHYLVEAVRKFQQLDTNPSLVGANPSLSLRAFKYALQEANQEDLRTIWDWDHCDLLVISWKDGLVQMSKKLGRTKEEPEEQAWERLLQMLHPCPDWMGN